MVGIIFIHPLRVGMISSRKNYTDSSVLDSEQVLPTWLASQTLPGFPAESLKNSPLPVSSSEIRQEA